MSEVRQGQVYAGRLDDGRPVVVRVQRPPAEWVDVVALSSDLAGRTAVIPFHAFGTRLKLVSENPYPKNEQVRAWLEEI
jgi:hypothetical protein